MASLAGLGGRLATPGGLSMNLGFPASNKTDWSEQAGARVREMIDGFTNAASGLFR
jgi:hypothetical protein